LELVLVVFENAGSAAPALTPASVATDP
jgi:hypothetical protein